MPKIPCAHYRENGERLGCAEIPDGRKPEPDGTIGVCNPARDGTAPDKCPSFLRCAHIDDAKPLSVIPKAKLPCAHFGEPTGETVRCPSCRGHVQLKIFTCSLLGTCTPEKEAPLIECCNGCIHHTHGQPALTPRLHKIQGLHVDPHRADKHGSHYNCSITEWRGKTLLASRFGWSGSTVWISELDSDYNVIEGTLRDLGIRHPRALSGVEDPRIFTFRDQLHLAVSGYDTKTKGGTSVFIARLNDDLRVETVWIPQYAKRRSWEKNWSFFEHDGKLHCVYEIGQASHQVILGFDGETGTELPRTKHALGFRGAALRGGASPLKIGGEFYSFFHTFKTDRRGMAVYGTSVYTFAASPPFQVLRKIPHVILTAGADIKGFSKSVCYPCGVILRGGKFIVSWGRHDRECWIAEFDRDEIEKRLQ